MAHQGDGVVGVGGGGASTSGRGRACARAIGGHANAGEIVPSRGGAFFATQNVKVRGLQAVQDAVDAVERGIFVAVVVPKRFDVAKGGLDRGESDQVEAEHPSRKKSRIRGVAVVQRDPAVFHSLGEKVRSKGKVRDEAVLVDEVGGEAPVVVVVVFRADDVGRLRTVDQGRRGIVHASGTPRSKKRGQRQGRWRRNGGET